jgi:hypothetical protein
MSVIALAFAFFPAFAQAECTSSSCVQYTESIPQVEGGNAPAHHQQTPAKASKTGDGGGAEPGMSNGSPGSKGAGGDGEGGSSEKEGAVPGGKGNGQGKPGGSANDGAKPQLHPGGQNGSAVPTSKSDDGDSSPLVPILIAIAILAAISVAVVMIRQRRQRRGPTATATPEAH